MENTPLLDEIHTRGAAWRWFTAHAQSRFALVWLALVAYTDTVFSPLSVEPFLAALVLAHRDRWRAYLATALIFSCLGTATGYWIFFWMYRSFGEALLMQWGYADAYGVAQTLLSGNIFWAMLAASLTPLPDKAFIYAAGILGAPFAPFMAAFVLGRGVRMAVVTYLTWRFGPAVLEAFDRYAVWASVIVIALFGVYIVVHFGLVP
jgi:membrane protein YqaA with SNARE-associated domain